MLTFDVDVSMSVVEPRGASVMKSSVESAGSCDVRYAHRKIHGGL